jgi:hypothetical protein
MQTELCIIAVNCTYAMFGKRDVKCCLGGKSAASKNNILEHGSKTLPTVSPFYGINSSVCVVLEIFSTKKKRKNETSKSWKRLKGAKRKDLEDTLVIWIGKMHIKMKRQITQVLRKKGKIFGK